MWTVLLLPELVGTLRLQAVKGLGMRTVLVVASVALLATAVQAATVKAEHGVIVLNGKALTSGGRDSDPVLSPDHKRIVFVRGIGDKPVSDCSAGPTETPNAELWTVNADGSGARKLLSTKPDGDMKKTMCDFQGLQFSSSGQLLYFETPAWATSGALHVYDFRAGKEHFVIDSNGTQVLATCKEPDYRDRLIVVRHEYFVFGGSYDWPWLISPEGKNLGLVGGENVDGDAIVKEACR
jgi:hypothetical protein